MSLSRKQIWLFLFYKAISWRIISFVIVGIILYFMTGSLTIAISVGIIDTIVKIVLYMVHERLWQKLFKKYKKKNK